MHKDLELNIIHANGGIKNPCEKREVKTFYCEL